MTTQRESRRTLLKTTAITSAWVTPVIQSVVLPAHAQTSVDTQTNNPDPGVVQNASTPVIFNKNGLSIGGSASLPDVRPAFLGSVSITSGIDAATAMFEFNVSIISSTNMINTLVLTSPTNITLRAGELLNFLADATFNSCAIPTTFTVEVTNVTDAITTTFDFTLSCF